jgi:hypothetical protein
MTESQPTRLHGNGFAMVPHWLVDQVDPRALQIFALLCRYARPSGAAFPSRKTMASQLGVTTKTIDRGINDLVFAGAILVGE